MPRLGLRQCGDLSYQQAAKAPVRVHPAEAMCPESEN